MNPFSQRFHFNFIFIALAFLSLLTYPTLYTTIHSYEIAIPSLFILSGLALLSFIFIQINLVKKKKFIIAIFLAYFIPIVIGLFINQTVYLHNLIIFSGYIIIPLVVALLYQNFNKQEKINLLITHIFCLIWLVNTMIYFFTFKPLGLAGNQNWFAQIALCCSPFTILYIKNKSFAKTLKILLSSIAIFITLYLIYISKSRGAWLSLLSLIYLYLFFRLSLKKRLILIFSTAIIISFSYFHYQKQLHKLYQQDIRGPLYKSTIQMIIDTPIQFLTGVGAGNFRKNFVKYRSDEHKKRGVAAQITEHPHNEFLLLASSIGVISALIWLLLSLKVILIKPHNYFLKACQFSFISLFIHGLLDKVLTSPPTSLIFPVLFGLLLAKPLASYIKINWNLLDEKIQMLKIFISLSLFLYLVYLSFHFLISDYYFRQATQNAYSHSIKEIEKSRNFYILSTETNPYKIKGYLEAVQTDFFKLYPQLNHHQQKKILKRSEHELLLASKIEPNYAHINKLWGFLYAQKYLHYHDKRFIKKSLHEYDKYTQRYPYRGDALFDRFNNLLFFNKENKALQSLPHVMSIYLQKFNNFFDNPYEELMSFTQHVVKAKRYKNNEIRLYRLLQRVVSQSKDFYFHQEMKNLPAILKQKFEDSVDYELDVFYWYQYLSIYKKIAKLSIKQIINNDFEKIATNPKRTHYLMPINHWQQTKSSLITKASFLAFCGTLKGYTTYILINKNNYQVIFINDKENFIADINKKNITPYKKPFILAKDSQIIINTFPQEFRMQIPVMHHLLSQNKFITPITIMPSLRLIEAQKIFPKKQISFLQQTKKFFTEKLKK